MKQQNIIPLNKVEKTERYIVVPRLIKGKVHKVVKPLKKIKGNCLFTCNMPHTLIDFIYRSVKKLHLQDNKYIFSRGNVYINNKVVHNAVSTVTLEWDLGTSFIIPLRLQFNSFVIIEVDNKDYSVRLMELVILIALMAQAYPSLPRSKHVSNAQRVLTLGWKSIE